MDASLEQTYQELRETAKFRGIGETVGSKGLPAASTMASARIPRGSDASQPRRKMTLEEERALYVVRTANLETLADKADVDTLRDSLGVVLEGYENGAAPFSSRSQQPETFVTEAHDRLQNDTSISPGWRASSRVLQKASMQVVCANTSQPLVVSQVLGNYRQNVPVDTFVRRIRPRPKRPARPHNYDVDQEWCSNFALEGSLAPLEA